MATEDRILSQDTNVINEAANMQFRLRDRELFPDLHKHLAIYRQTLPPPVTGESSEQRRHSVAGILPNANVDKAGNIEIPGVKDSGNGAHAGNQAKVGDKNYVPSPPAPVADSREQTHPSHILSQETVAAAGNDRVPRVVSPQPNGRRVSDIIESATKNNDAGRGARLIPDALGGADQDAERQKVNDLIVRLGDQKFAVRQSASKALEGLGDKAFGAIARASLSTDPETAKRASELLEKILPSPRTQLDKIIEKGVISGFKNVEDDYQNLIKANEEFAASARRTNLLNDLKGLTIPPGSKLAEIHKRLSRPEEATADAMMEYALDHTRLHGREQIRKGIYEGVPDARATEHLVNALKLNPSLASEKRFIKIAALAVADTDSAFKRQFDNAKGDKEFLKRMTAGRPTYSPAELDPDIHRRPDFDY